MTALDFYGVIHPDSRLTGPAFNLLTAEVRLSKAGLMRSAQIAKMNKTAVGAIAPDFTLTDTAGKPVSLHDFKGKYVLIDFWASWCGPCQAENPNLVKLFNLYKNKNLTILGVSADGSKAKLQWLKAINDDHLIWTEVADLLKGSKNEAMVLYNIDNIPRNILVSPDGNIVDKDLRGEDLANTLQKLFNK